MERRQRKAADPDEHALAEGTPPRKHAHRHSEFVCACVATSATSLDSAGNRSDLCSYLVHVERAVSLQTPAEVTPRAP